MTRMAAAVKVEEGRWKLKNDHELSMLVVFFILSATSVTGRGGGEADLHILLGGEAKCQWRVPALRLPQY